MQDEVSLGSFHWLFFGSLTKFRQKLFPISFILKINPSDRYPVKLLNKLKEFHLRIAIEPTGIRIAHKNPIRPGIGG
jgi:hypothetical protein